MASFLYPNFDILRHQFNHPTRNQPSEPPRTLINRLQDASRRRQEPRSSVPALLPERLQEPHPSLEDWPSQPYADDPLPHPPLWHPRRFFLRRWPQGPWIQLLLRKLRYVGCLAYYIARQRWRASVISME